MNKTMKKMFFVAALAMVAACNIYDDSELRGRVDELEDKVEAHEQWLKQLDASVKSLNDASSAFTELLNGGVITDVKPVTGSDGRTGYEFTVTTGSSKSTYTIWNGTDGEQGEAPQIGVAQDTDGRYYWTLNGKPMTDGSGNKIYASGEKGDKGDKGDKGEQGEQGEQGKPGNNGTTGATGQQGWTPRLKVDTDPAKAGTDDEETLYWWVGYDKNNDGQIKEEDGEKWESLGVEANTTTGTASGLDMTYDEQSHKVTFTKNGVVVCSFDVSFPNHISVSFTVDGKETPEYESIYIKKGDRAEVSVTVEGAGENAIVKAELLNAAYGYSIYVDGMDIEVTATEAGRANKLLIEVLDGAASYHTWLSLEPVFSASLAIAEVDDYDYMPVAFGDGYESLESVPVKPTLTLSIDAAATKDITFRLGKDEVEDADEIGHLTVAESVTIKKGETSVVVPCEITSRAGLICDSGSYIYAEADGIEETGAYLFIANNFNKKIVLTADNYACPFDGSGSGEGQGVGALCDDNPSTMLGTFYWNDEAFTTYAAEIAVYGVYVDVTIPVSVANVQFKYQNRNGLNGQPRGLKIGAELNGEMKVIGTKTEGFNETNSGWNETEKLNVGGLADKFRFGVTHSQTQQANVLTENPAGSMTLAELQIFVMY